LKSDFKKATREASELLENSQGLNEKLEAAIRKADKYKSRLLKIWDDLQWLFRFVKAYTVGEYRKVPWKVIMLAVAAILYFLNPMDIVPDFLSGLGFIDDATVIALVMNAISEHLDDFKQYWAQQKSDSAIPVEPVD